MFVRAGGIGAQWCVVKGGEEDHDSTNSGHLVQSLRRVAQGGMPDLGVVWQQ